MSDAISKDKQLKTTVGVSTKPRFIINRLQSMQAQPHGSPHLSMRLCVRLCVWV